MAKLTRIITLLLCFSLFPVVAGEGGPLWQGSSFDKTSELMKKRSELLNSLRQENTVESVVKVALAEYKLSALFMNDDPVKSMTLLHEGRDRLLALEDEKLTEKQKKHKYSLLYGIYNRMIPLNQKEAGGYLEQMTALYDKCQALEENYPWMALESAKSKYYWDPASGLTRIEETLTNQDKVCSDEPGLRAYVEEEALLWKVRLYQRLKKGEDAEKAFSDLLAVNENYETMKSQILGK